MSNILLGICGSIAAYKAAVLARLFIKANHNVKVVMTTSAEQFICPLTFSALTGHPTYTDQSENSQNPMLHIDLAKWADTIIIAPASANCISELAHGLACNLLTTICLATRATCFIAPAMNQAMWQHPATQHNLNQLQQFGYQLLQPESGEQACGDVGTGRLMEPEKIVDHLFKPDKRFANTQVLITAGPTFEKLDPIRYLGNFSSGKMGYALASAFSKAGANVTLISGPTHLPAPQNCSFVSVTTAAEMLTAVNKYISNSHIFISVAAVANYTATPSTQKIKSTSDELLLKLQKNPDILQHVCQQNPHIFSIGFCAETNDLINAAKAKRVRKGADIMIANQVTERGAPFGAAHNQVIYINDKQTIALEPMTKSALADKLVGLVATDYGIAYPRSVS